MKKDDFIVRIFEHTPDYGPAEVRILKNGKVTFSVTAQIVKQLNARGKYRSCVLFKTGTKNRSGLFVFVKSQSPDSIKPAEIGISLGDEKLVSIVAKIETKTGKKNGKRRRCVTLIIKKQVADSIFFKKPFSVRERFFYFVFICSNNYNLFSFSSFIFSIKSFKSI